jgi:amidase
MIAAEFDSYDATSGPDIGDPYWAPPPARPFLEEVGRDPGRLRIAITTRPWNGEPVDPECAETALAAARLCERLGHHVEEATPVIDATLLGEASRIVVSANVRAGLEARAAALGRELTAGDVERIMFGPIFEPSTLHGVGPRVEEPAIGLSTQLYFAAPYEDIRLKKP